MFGGKSKADKIKASWEQLRQAKDGPTEYDPHFNDFETRQSSKQGFSERSIIDRLFGRKHSSITMFKTNIPPTEGWMAASPENEVMDD